MVRGAPGSLYGALHRLATEGYNVDGDLGYVINPRILELRDSSGGPEACLSIPGISAVAARAAYAVVEGVDRRQEPNSPAPSAAASCGT